MTINKIKSFFKQDPLYKLLNEELNFGIIDTSVDTIQIVNPSNSSSGLIFICRFDNDETKKIVMRIIPDNLFWILNFISTTNGIFPKILYINEFNKYCIEQYIEGRQLSFLDLSNKEIVMTLINKIKKMHDTPKIIFQNTHVLFCNVLTAKFENALFITKNTPKFDNISQLRKNLEYIQNFFVNDTCMTSVNIHRETPNIVISHNDIHVDNVIMNNNNDIILIDPEYTSLNHWIYDFVNLMEETRIYFNKDVQQPDYKLFVENDCLNNFDQHQLNTIMTKIDENIIECISVTHNISIDIVGKYVEIFRIYPNIFWYLWAIEKFYESPSAKLQNYLLVRWCRIQQLV